jgi:hypothetical protein
MKTFVQDKSFLMTLHCFIVSDASEAFLNNGAGNSGADTASSSRLLSPPPAASTAPTVVPGETDNSLESGEWAADEPYIHTCIHTHM